MLRNINIEEFIQYRKTVAIVDVRTPAEYEHGHIPGAINLPLFSNEQRAKVGTTYTQIGREEAILLGFELTGPKWAEFIRAALLIAPNKKVLLHCWRGGMRSGAMGWAFSLYGFDVSIIEGGYKNYRRWVHQQFEKNYQLLILGGMTGSGKTRVLHQLQFLGEQVVDLEDLAQHQGSTYGTKNTLIQPTQEQFENNLSDRLNSLAPAQTIWVEDESFTIGRNAIPHAFWTQMVEAPLIEMVVNEHERIGALAQEYGCLDKAFLEACTHRIRKRLGLEQTKKAIEAIWEDRMEDFIKIALVYYDKTYRNCLLQRKKSQVHVINFDLTEDAGKAGAILAFKQMQHI